MSASTQNARNDNEEVFLYALKKGNELITFTPINYEQIN